MKRIIIYIVITLILVGILYYGYCNIKSYKVTGYSMSPTLLKNQKVLGIKDKDIMRGDIICFYKMDTYTIKRVIGIPGDTVDIKSDGTVYINNELLKEDYLVVSGIGEIEIDLPVTLNDKEYFVLGDNRLDSYDSKNIKVGLIKEDEIVARIFFNVSTFKKI